MRQEFGRPLKTLDVPGYRLRETLYNPAQEIAAHRHPWATLCLTVEGGYLEDWGVTRVRCDGPSLVFHPPGDVYGDRISDAGSRCLTIGVDPAVFSSAADAIPSLAHLRASRRAPPSWLAFQLHQELELGDDLSAASVEGTVLALLAEVCERPALEVHGAPPPWLERVKEQIHDEFARGPSLESLAHAAGVHRVHLAREFRRRFGCTPGQYIRQRRIEFACHRLAASREPLSVVAFDAGFADQSHFTNTFRRLVGTTPGAFRAQFSSAPR
jgi:AraC family transcriptional regulator